MVDVIDEIMESFNFEKVHNVMTLLGWKWFGRSGSKVPSIKEIKETAMFVLKDLESNSENIASGTGGFEARRQQVEDGEMITLSFIVTSKFVVKVKEKE